MQGAQAASAEIATESQRVAASKFASELATTFCQEASLRKQLVQQVGPLLRAPLPVLTGTATDSG